jgi:F-type H+-transporting ATPase subunit epsilon
MAALTLEIVTPEKRVATMQADEVRAPGAAGGFGIRRDHTPFMSRLDAGRLAVVGPEGERHFAVGGGFLQVADNRVIVLADSCEEREEIDVARAERAFREATERLRSLAEGDETYPEESARVRRAAARLGVARRE